MLDDDTTSRWRWVLLLCTRAFFSGVEVEVVGFFLTAWSVVAILFSSRGAGFGFFLTTLSVVSVSGVDLGFVEELRCFTSLTGLGASVVAVFVVVFLTLGVEAVGWLGPFR